MLNNLFDLMKVLDKNGSQKLTGFILCWPLLSLANFMSIHAKIRLLIEIFQCGLIYRSNGLSLDSRILPFLEEKEKSISITKP